MHFRTIRDVDCDSCNEARAISLDERIYSRSPMDVDYPETSIFDFHVFELLGRGGFAQVYRAKSIITGQEVAIKMIDKKAMLQHGLTNRVRREVEIHSRLKHPSILELYTCFEDANYVYLVLEICHNGELQTYIRQNGPVSEDVARHYLKQLISGLVYLHSHNILHRDLTLANLLLTKDMKVKIADFGLATKIEPGEDHKTMCGTPNYISPEVASHGQQGLETDVWSVGCMFYTLIVGRPPFDTREVRSTLNRVLAVDYELPTTLSPEATDLIGCLLKRHPQERIKLRAIAQHPFMCKKAVNPRLMETSNDSGIDSMARTPLGCLTNNLTRSSTTKSEASAEPHSRPPLGLLSAALSDAQYQVSSTPYFQTFPRQSSFSGTIGSAGSVPPKSAKSASNTLPRSGTLDQESYLQMGTARVTLPSCPSAPNPNRGLTSLSGLSMSSVSRPTGCTETVTAQTKPDTRRSQSRDSSRRPVGVRSRMGSGSNSVESRPSPLNGRRLRPMRTYTRLAVINIFDDESVCVEFLRGSQGKRKESMGRKPTDPSCFNGDRQLVVMEVMGIDRTGMQIVVYQPGSLSHGVPLDTRGLFETSQSSEPCDSTQQSGFPPRAQPGDHVSLFWLDKLPEKYWKKYQFVSKFITMVRAHTPKITMYSQRAKCMLMENGPPADFLAEFYEDETRIACSADGSIRITQIDPGSSKPVSIILDSDRSLTALAPTTRGLLDYVSEQREKCQTFEKLLSASINQCSTIDELRSCPFPAIIGRRPKPAGIVHSNSKSAAPAQTSLCMVNCGSTLADLPATLLDLISPSVAPDQRCAQIFSTSSKPVFIPQVGWADQRSADELQVQFNDGAQLLLTYDRSLVRSIHFTPPPHPDGTVGQMATAQRYTTSDPLPDEVHRRLELMPLVIQHLRMQSS
ncbi:Serine/threonine-protein kinase PLK4 [Fasciola gigantica]|uniref:Serine/threonine-protein kinase PLK4 n=1 Tax=Fasciola gigantica TaxID=46835 RepID=A0A504YXI7_FASGI|nr:Serine/threonine-protein kinase PLK4 [Fasciola gigantica]